MSRKTLIFSTILLLAIVSVCFLSTSSVNTNNVVENRQNDNNFETLSNPKSSGYAVSQKWNVTTAETVYSVAISADGKYMVFGTAVGTGYELCLKKVSNNQTIWTYNFAEEISSVAISADGKYIAAGGVNPGVVGLLLFNNSIPTGAKEPIWTFDTGNDCYMVDISADGKYIVAGTENTGVLLFNNSIPVGAKKPHWHNDILTGTAEPWSVAISADGEYIVVGRSPGSSSGVLFFNNSYHSGTDKLPEWNYTTGVSVKSVAISAKGEYVAAGCVQNVGGQELFIFNKSADGGNPEWSLEYAAAAIYSVALSADGEFIATGSSLGGDGEVVLYSNSKQNSEWSGITEGVVNSVDITADGKYVVAGTDYDASATANIRQNTIFLFNITEDNPGNGNELPEWAFNTSDDVNSVSISSWGNYIGAGGDEGNGAAGEALLFYHARPIPKGGYAVTERWNYPSTATVNVVAVSANGKYMVAGTDMDPVGPEIFFFNTSDHDGIPMWSYDADQTIDSLAISANGKYMVVGGSAGSAFLFNSTVPDQGVDKQYMWSSSVFSDLPYVDISADGKLFVVGGNSAGQSELYLYNNVGDLLWFHIFGFSPQNPLSVTISADGKYVAMGRKVAEQFGSINKTVYLFNTTDYTVGQRQEPMWSFDTGQDMDSVAISADGKDIVAGSSNGKIAYLFNSSVPELGNNKLPVWNFSLDTGGVNSVDISADGKDIVLGLEATEAGEDAGFIVLLNNSRPTLDPYDKQVNDEWLWIYETGGNVSSVAITADGEYVVAGTDYNPDIGEIFENTVFLFNNTDYTYGASHDPNWYFNTSNHVNSVSISAWGNYIGAGGDSTSGETFLFYHARPIPGIYFGNGGGDDDDDDDEEGAIPFGNHYLLFAAIAVASLVIIKKRKVVFSKK